ncbi:hypothetical protein NT2_25_00080 [Caenibius tardaugens NBRC 16725]|uniref:Stress-response A/B barrel domain-containing protein n=1 Tax=Caenibius tardaugens NBRC 16725 TaxID=1219035 RepID=U2YR25_9SPHN|nr:Dabb family protein [Caenibius tardaugens]AZI35265.1 Dabb family protein [Caenibius tardaugens NBRC 16725]GAD51172.1 hypothetical protein NT2_25_00080 [Caenibius tardaugens NBRC 16725]
MYNLLKVIGVTDKARDNFGPALSDATQALPGITSSLVAPTLPGVYNGGDYIWRVSFTDQAAAQAAIASDAGQAVTALLNTPSTITSLEGADFETGHAGGDRDAASGLYRVALFCANRNPTPERLRAFSRDTQIMPNHVRSIVRWELSQSDLSTGGLPWTHIWEQEYADRTGLEGPYMMHPVHWAHVERWFDTEYPDYLVDRHLVHTFCALDQAILNR